MIDALLDVPSHLRERLASALESGLLAQPPSEASLRSILGESGPVGAVAQALAELRRLGVAGPAAGAWIRSMTAASSRSRLADLVWSGPQVPGVHSRDTRRVYEELVASAERSLWVSTFAFFDGPKAFAVLARRMEAMPGLRVRLLLNVQRRRGDQGSADELVRRFAERFWSSEWPGAVRPEVYFDPRSLELDAPSGVLHAKAVIVDEHAVFVTSANLTEAALDRNIELGVVIRDRALARSIAAHLLGLIEGQALKALPLR